MLSVCLIAKNEEALIGDCLRSVRGIADEIIVLDTGSTDRTVEIARALGCRVYSASWSGDFAAARNLACSYATHNWILSIDCDERLLFPECIVKAIREARPETGCYILERHNEAVSADGERSTEIRGNARLFRNHRGIAWTHRVHEEPWSSCLAQGLELAHCDAVLLHQVWSLGHTTFLEKQSHYGSMLTEMADENPQQHALVHLAKTRMIFGDDERALAVFDLARHANGYELHNAAFVECYSGYAHFRLQQPEQAIECYNRALELIPNLSTAHYFYAQTHLKQGHPDKALEHIEALTPSGALHKPLTIADMYFSPVQLNYLKAYAMLQTGNRIEARRLLESIPFDTPDAARTLALLSRIYFIAGNSHAVQQYIEQALVLNPTWEHLKQLQKNFA